jgi:hypothetical protein
MYLSPWLIDFCLKMKKVCYIIGVLAENQYICMRKDDPLPPIIFPLESLTECDLAGVIDAIRSGCYGLIPKSRL